MDISKIQNTSNALPYLRQNDQPNEESTRRSRDEFHRSMFGAMNEAPDSGLLHECWNAYSGRALSPILTWIDGRIKDPKAISYDEVICELEKFKPEYNSLEVFSTDVLLPKLKKSGKLASLPESLVAVLYTLDIVRSENGTHVMIVKKELKSILITMRHNFDVCNGEITSERNFRIENYLDPERAERKFIPDY